MRALPGLVAALMDPVAPWRALGYSFAYSASPRREPGARRLRARPAANAGAFFMRACAEAPACAAFIRALGAP